MIAGMFVGPAIAGAMTGGGGLALALIRARLRDNRSKQLLVVEPLKPTPVGDGWQADLLCWFRGLYGDYPREFRSCHVELTPGGLRLRARGLLRFRQPAFEIAEHVLSVRERPIGSGREARLMLGSAGLYGPDGPLREAGYTIACWRTSRGLLEFGVVRRDLPLFRQYTDVMRRRAVQQ